jgi:hypothetical protein
MLPDGPTTSQRQYRPRAPIKLKLQVHYKKDYVCLNVPKGSFALSAASALFRFEVKGLPPSQIRGRSHLNTGSRVLPALDEKTGAGLSECVVLTYSPGDPWGSI